MSVRVNNELTITWGDLPHWQVGGSVYHVTFRTLMFDLTPPERSVVAAAILWGSPERYDFHIGVVMPDHVHMVVGPREREPGVWWDVGDLMKSIKGYSARRILQGRGISGPLWQRERHDRLLRSEGEYRNALWYVAENPWRAGLVTPDEDYPFLIVPKGLSNPLQWV